MTDVNKPIGFRHRTPPFGHHGREPWCLWIGPLTISRLERWRGLKPEVQILRWCRYVGASALGISVGVTY